MQTPHFPLFRRTLILAFFIFLAAGLFLPGQDIANVGDHKNILPMRERARVTDEWLKWRLENIIPPLMRREGILMFYDLGSDKGVDRLSGSYFELGPLYKPTWDDKKEMQFDSLAKAIKARNPKKIGIDISNYWAFGDGLSAVMKTRLEKALGPEYASRLVSAEGLCLGWLETRSPQDNLRNWTRYHRRVLFEQSHHPRRHHHRRRELVDPAENHRPRPHDLVQTRNFPSTEGNEAEETPG